MCPLISAEWNEFAASLENYLKAKEFDVTINKLEMINRYVNS